MLAVEILRAMCEGCSPSWLRPHATVIVRALDCSSIWESRDPRLSTQIARCASQLAATCGSLLLDKDRAHLLRIVLGLQVKAWSFGARDVPPLAVDDGPLDHYNRTWTTLQTVCTRAADQIAGSAGMATAAFIVQQLPAVVEHVMPVCCSYGPDLELGLLEVCVPSRHGGACGGAGLMQHRLLACPAAPRWQSRWRRRSSRRMGGGR